jgi:hypothetical protein
MAGVVSSDISYIYILLLIMIIMCAISIKFLDIEFNWGKMPLVMMLGFVTLYLLHPGFF